MKPTPSNDAWMDESHRATEWGATLKPQRSSNRALIAITLIGVALLAFLYFRSAEDVGSKARPKEQPVVQPKVSPPPLPNQQRSAAEQAPPQRIQRVAKCLSPTGAVTYSDGPCPTSARPGAIDLRPDRNLADGMSDRARNDSLRQNAAAAQAIALHERRVASNVDQASTECTQLDALIAAIDSAARQPQPGLEQDRLREQRKRARDRQFALRCL